MQRGARPRFPDRVQARAELAAARIGVVVIDAQAVVEGERRCDLPFILQVQALDPLRLRSVVRDRSRHFIGRRANVRGQHQRSGGAAGAIVLQVPAASYSVCVIELVGRIGLPAERVVALVGPLRNAIVEQVADRIGLERQTRIAAAQ